MPLRGNWKGIIKKLGSLEKVAVQKIRQAVGEAGEEVEAIVVKNLEEQRLPWRPLKPSYKRRKMRIKGKGGKRLSEKILIATGTYLENITTAVSIDGLSVFVGVIRGNARYEDGTDVVDIAAIHEYGAPSRNIPARPLWKPSFEEAKESVTGIFKEKLREIL